MKPLSLSVVLLAILFSFSISCRSGQKVKEGQAPKVTFNAVDVNKRIDVMIDGKLFTAFQWPDNICKPVLYPVCTSAGTEITRGFPVKPRDGERADHPHQIGLWLTYGNVNGLDFWGNGSEGLDTRNANGGVIKHLKIDKMSEGNGEGLLASTESWIDSSGIELLKEHTEYHFIAKGTLRMIDRITTLTAGDTDISMPDTKEGMFGLRVARQLELPSKGETEFVNAEGKITKVAETSNEGITGNYISSEGITGEAVWGTRARWMDLSGNIDNEKISIAIIDHPKNQGYPTYWHARGYGLFSANPLGAKDFTRGKEVLNFSLPAGKSTTFRYRVVISSGSHLTNDEINKLSDDFAAGYNQ